MKLVKCINNKNRESILTIDKVYCVLYENDFQYEVICDDKLATLLHKIRFEEVETHQPKEEINKEVNKMKYKNIYPKVTDIIVEEFQTKEELIKPTYYNKDNGISPFEYIKANNLDFFEGNVIKYITRYKEKNGLEDLKKAKTYLEEILKNYKN